MRDWYETPQAYSPEPKTPSYQPYCLKSMPELKEQHLCGGTHWEGMRCLRGRPLESTGLANVLTLRIQSPTVSQPIPQNYGVVTFWRVGDSVLGLV